MNILQIISSSRLSGAEKHALLLSSELNKLGHNVTLVAPPGGWLSDQASRAGIDLISLPFYGLAGASSFGDMKRIVTTKQIDLIHTHLTCATYFGTLLGKMMHRPVVASLHVHSRDFVYRKLLPKKQNQIIAVSNFVREGLVKNGVPESHLRTIYNGTEFTAASVELSALSVRAELNLLPDSVLVGIFGHVGEFKGHMLLVEAAGLMLNTCPNAYFVCVGNVDPAMQKTLWELAAKRGVADRFRFTGPRNDVPRLMSSMDVITLPSRYEACSMVILEAMAMQKAVVATNAGGNPELITSGETGLLIDRTPKDLSEALTQLIHDKPQREAFGVAGCNVAVQRFTVLAMAQNVSNLYGEMLGSR